MARNFQTTFSVYLGAKLSDKISVSIINEPSNETDCCCNHAKDLHDYQSQFQKNMETLLKNKTEEILFLIKYYEKNEKKHLTEINSLKKQLESCTNSQAKPSTISCPNTSKEISLQQTETNSTDVCKNERLNVTNNQNETTKTPIKTMRVVLVDCLVNGSMLDQEKEASNAVNSADLKAIGTKKRVSYID